MVDLQPDVADVLQEEDGGGLTVPVCITEQKAPLRTQALPRKGGATMTKALTTTPLRVLTADHRRAVARVISTATANVFLFAHTEASAQDESTMSLWPGLVPLPVEATTELWLRVPATPGTGFSVGISTSLWAEGE